MALPDGFCSAVWPSGTGRQADRAVCAGLTTGSTHQCTSIAPPTAAAAPVAARAHTLPCPAAFDPPAACSPCFCASAEDVLTTAITQEVMPSLALASSAVATCSGSRKLIGESRPVKPDHTVPGCRTMRQVMRPALTCSIKLVSCTRRLHLRDDPHRQRCQPLLHLHGLHLHGECQPACVLAPWVVQTTAPARLARVDAPTAPTPPFPLWPCSFPRLLSMLAPSPRPRSALPSALKRGGCHSRHQMPVQPEYAAVPSPRHFLSPQGSLHSITATARLAARSLHAPCQLQWAAPSAASPTTAHPVTGLPGHRVVRSLHAPCQLPIGCARAP